jgi:hypothetical protein
MKVTDIEGVELQLGDAVYYARKCDFHASGELVKTIITNISEKGYVKMGKYESRRPQNQLIKIRYK